MNVYLPNSSDAATCGILQRIAFDTDLVDWRTNMPSLQLRTSCWHLPPSVIAQDQRLTSFDEVVAPAAAFVPAGLAPNYPRARQNYAMSFLWSVSGTVYSTEVCRRDSLTRGNSTCRRQEH
jgi:hypothetical protein